MQARFTGARSAPGAFFLETGIPPSWLVFEEHLLIGVACDFRFWLLLNHVSTNMDWSRRQRRPLGPFVAGHAFTANCFPLLPTLAKAPVEKIYMAPASLSRTKRSVRNYSKCKHSFTGARSASAASFLKEYFPRRSPFRNTSSWCGVQLVF